MEIRIILKSFNNEKLINVSENLINILLKNNCKIKGIVSLPNKIKRFCVLRSPHIDKDSREHFEIKIFKRILDFDSNSSIIFDNLLKFEIPAGVSCFLKVVKN